MECREVVRSWSLRQLQQEKNKIAPTVFFFRIVINRIRDRRVWVSKKNSKMCTPLKISLDQFNFEIPGEIPLGTKR